MPSRTKANASDRARSLARRFGSELRIARLNAGLSQRAVATRAGVTQQLVSDAERGDTGIGLEIRCRLVAAVGHELSWKLFPVASVPLRDSGQLELAQAIIRSLPPGISARVEVPVAAGDPRAADLLISGPAELIHVEIERSLVDFQAQVRAAQLKRQELATRASHPVRLVMAMPDSTRARAVVAAIENVVRANFPITSRQVAMALRTGTPIGGDGLLFVRAGRLTTQSSRSQPHGQR